MIYKSKVKISKTDIDYVNRKLLIEEEDMLEDGCDTAETIATAKFNNKYEMDIKLCSGTSNYFLDVVLFNEKGGETGCCCDYDHIPSKIEFEDDDDAYLLTISSK